MPPPPLPAPPRSFPNILAAKLSEAERTASSRGHFLLAQLLLFFRCQHQRQTEKSSSCQPNRPPSFQGAAIGRAQSGRLRAGSRRLATVFCAARYRPWPKDDDWRTERRRPIRRHHRRRRRRRRHHRIRLRLRRLFFLLQCAPCRGAVAHAAAVAMPFVRLPPARARTRRGTFGASGPTWRGRRAGSRPWADTFFSASPARVRAGFRGECGGCKGYGGCGG